MRDERFVKRMLEDPRPPFRWTAAWVMGKIGAAEFAEPLERAKGGKEAHVRNAAERMLEMVRARNTSEAGAVTGGDGGKKKTEDGTFAMKYDGKRHETVPADGG